MCRRPHRDDVTFERQKLLRRYAVRIRRRLVTLVGTMNAPINCGRASPGVTSNITRPKTIGSCPMFLNRMSRGGERRLFVYRSPSCMNLLGIVPAQRSIEGHAVTASGLYGVTGTGINHRSGGHRGRSRSRARWIVSSRSSTGTNEQHQQCRHRQQFAPMLHHFSEYWCAATVSRAVFALA